MKFDISKLLLTCVIISSMAFGSVSFVNASGLNTGNSSIDLAKLSTEDFSSDTNYEVYDLNIQFRQTMNVPNNITESELNELVPIMNTTNWEYNALENIFERYVSYEGLNVNVNTEDGSNLTDLNGTNTTDANGNVRIFSPESDRINLQITDPLTNLSFIKEINANSVEDNPIIIDIDFSSMLVNDAEYMLKKTGSSSGISIFASSTNPYWEAGEAGVTGKRLHCNRFNGTGGDNKYWSHFSVQGLINFVGSDCDYSASVTLACIADDLPLVPNHCEAGIAPDKSGSKEATCSGEQGLSRYFHFR